MSRNLEFLPIALREAKKGYRWYFVRSPQAANRFAAELGRVINNILEFPERYPAHLHGTRVIQLRRFPYHIVYRILGDNIQIIAVAQGNRKPGYWKQRTKDT